MIKFDGSSVTQFGSEENASNIPVSFLTMYRGRLFAAGDAANPDRLYYSVLPGSGRTVEQWGAVEASPAVEGGHVEIGALGGDPIVAVRALSNQLLIFKRTAFTGCWGTDPPITPLNISTRKYRRQTMPPLPCTATCCISERRTDCITTTESLHVPVRICAA